nr:TPA_asm: m142 uoORF RNA *1 [Murid betaherpesvirus 1]DBA08109.1 TPA_asm: m142 uoORF RNA *1 [Murid betaherpesvirus 1]
MSSLMSPAPLSHLGDKTPISPRARRHRYSECVSDRSRTPATTLLHPCSRCRPSPSPWTPCARRSDRITSETRGLSASGRAPAI